jgi:hypothetical protein
MNVLIKTDTMNKNRFKIKRLHFDLYHNYNTTATLPTVLPDST